MIHPSYELLEVIGTAADVVDCRYDGMVNEEVRVSVSFLLANLVWNYLTNMLTYPICLEVFSAVALKVQFTCKANSSRILQGNRYCYHVGACFFVVFPCQMSIVLLV